MGNVTQLKVRDSNGAAKDLTATRVTPDEVTYSDLSEGEVINRVTATVSLRPPVKRGGNYKVAVKIKTPIGVAALDPVTGVNDRPFITTLVDYIIPESSTVAERAHARYTPMDLIYDLVGAAEIVDTKSVIDDLALPH